MVDYLNFSLTGDWLSYSFANSGGGFKKKKFFFSPLFE